MSPRRRAEVAYAMDILMHSLSDEEAAEGWLAYGVPDGTLTEGNSPTEEQLEDYREYTDGMSDEEWEEWASCFSHCLACGVFSGDGVLKYEKGSFA